MLCSAVCPNCRHQFTCCSPHPPQCASPPPYDRPCHVPSGGPPSPLAFVLPPPATPLPPSLAISAESELQRLSGVLRALRLSGWYYEGHTYRRSEELLKARPIGTFLVRNSSDSRYMFSLSMQTARGPLSVRLVYEDGLFQLETPAAQRAQMPQFPGVIEMIEYYVRLEESGRYHGQSWVDPHQNKCFAPIQLKRPLVREEARPQGLKHLARLAINRAMNGSNKLKLVQLELPTSLTLYMAEYPYGL